ncbi:MAG: 50S ribosomal protein L10 [Parcubacteria group bacterium]|nr:50S ribosomal protein L10 [Parcubacteria group bacterium]
MPKTRKEKEVIVQALAEDLNKAKSLVFTDYQGLSVNDIEELRNKIQEKEGDYKVIKNNLFQKALEKSELKGVEVGEMKGPLALGFGFVDEVAAAKEIYTFAKGKEVPKMSGGILEGKYLDEKEILALAKLPSKEELLAKVVGSINAPVSGFVNVLAGNLRGLVSVLNNIKEAKN